MQFLLVIFLVDYFMVKLKFFALLSIADTLAEICD